MRTPVLVVRFHHTASARSRARRQHFFLTSSPCIATYPYLNRNTYPLLLCKQYHRTNFAHQHQRFIEAALRSLAPLTAMAPGKLNPTSQPLAPSTATFDAPGSSFSTGTTSNVLLEQNKPAVSRSTSKTGSCRSASPHTGATMAPANMSATPAASSGWFGGWGRSKSAASRPTTHTRSKSWFGGGKNNTSGKRGSDTATTGLATTDLEDSSTASTIIPDTPSLGSSTTNTVSGSISGGDNDSSGDPGRNTEDIGPGTTNTGGSTTNDAAPVNIATESISNEAIEEEEEVEQAQHRPTSRVPYRELSLEELRSFKYKSGRKHLEAENSSLKEQLRNSFEAQLSSERERDQARDECRAAQEIVQQLKKEVSSLHKTNNELQVQSTSLQETREALENEISSLHAKNRELQVDSKSIKESKEALEKEVSSMYTTIDELKNDNASLEESKELEIASLHTTIDELKATNISLGESREALEDVLATEKERAQQSLEDARKALQKELDTANTHVIGLESKEATLRDSLQLTQVALTEEKLRSRELDIRLEERRASETKLETYLRSELEKVQALALQQAKDLEKLREDYAHLQLATATLEKPPKKHKITKNESQKLSEQNSELMRQLQHARAQSKQLANDLAAMEKKNEMEASKSKFSLRDIVRRPKNDTARPLTSHGSPKHESSRPFTSRADRRSMFL